jgi:hypothetical protein
LGERARLSGCTAEADRKEQSGEDAHDVSSGDGEEDTPVAARRMRPFDHAGARSR